MLSANKDRKGKVFVSTVEGRNYPVYATQVRQERLKLHVAVAELCSESWVLWFGRCVHVRACVMTFSCGIEVCVCDDYSGVVLYCHADWATCLEEFCFLTWWSTHELHM